MIWILFLWMQKYPSVTTQEFGSHDACVKAARTLQIEFGSDMRFMCVEKDPATPKKKRKS